MGGPDVQMGNLLSIVYYKGTCKLLEDTDFYFISFHMVGTIKYIVKLLLLLLLNSYLKIIININNLNTLISITLNLIHPKLNS